MIFSIFDASVNSLLHLRLELDEKNQDKKAQNMPTDAMTRREFSVDCCVYQQAKKKRL